MRSVPFLIAGVIVALLLVLAFAGCDDSPGPADPAQASGTKNYRAIVITYGGRPLKCVERKGSTGLDSTSGAFSGLSCDWVAYHEEG